MSAAHQYSLWLWLKLLSCSYIFFLRLLNMKCWLIDLYLPVPAQLNCEYERDLIVWSDLDHMMKTKIFVGKLKAIKTLPKTTQNQTEWLYLWCVVSIIVVTFLPFLVFAAISCVEESGEPANVTKCLRWAGPLPSQMRECHVPCRDDCTLTAWSKFSDCAGCGSSRTRKRSLIGKNSIFIHWMWDAVNFFQFTCGMTGFLG